MKRFEVNCRFELNAESMQCARDDVEYIIDAARGKMPELFADANITFTITATVDRGPCGRNEEGR